MKTMPSAVPQLCNSHDITRRRTPQPGATLSADRPEGNGTGIVWDDAGHVVTNYHVLGGALRNYRPGQGQQAPRVARVTLLGGATHPAQMPMLSAAQATVVLDLEPLQQPHIKVRVRPAEASS
jgi:hypothetical protein